MSISNPRQENPAKKFIEFKGDKGVFQYYEKDSKKNIELQMPIAFIVLDELSTISGFDNKSESGIYSNEIHRINDEILKVRSFKNNISVIGKYEDIKFEIKAVGGKFCKSVYAMLILKGDNPNEYKYEIVNFKFKGIAFSSWLDKKFNPEKYGVLIKETGQGQKGSIKYTFPIFEFFTKQGKEKMFEKAVEFDKELQKYLSWYKHQQLEKLESETSNEKENFIENNSQTEIEGIAKEENSDWNDLKNAPDEPENDLPF